ncbi:MAG: flippase-like domain-containing protein [Methanospirillum sp.]|nr:flippase-like domain-containing protein [Methanospirillum sp.]
MRRRGWLFVSVLISAGVLGLVLALTVDGATVAALGHLDWRWIAVAVLSHGAALLCWAGRVRVLSAGLGYDVPFRACVPLVLANVLAAAITPSSAGGEPVRAHELYRAGVRAGDATAVVAVERLLDFFLLLAAVLLAIRFLGRQMAVLGVEGGLLLEAIGVVVLAVAGLFLLALVSPGALRRVLFAGAGALGRVLPGGAAGRLAGTAARVEREAGHFRAAFGRFAGRGRGHLVGGLLFSAGYWLLEFSVASLVLLALGLPADWVLSVLCQILVNVIALIPLTPGGAGLAEASAASLYGLFVPSSSLGLLILLWRLIVYHLNIVLGLGAGVAIVRREASRRGAVREP